jgi:hypothetical protein
MNLTAARVMIKFLDGQDHHRAAVLMRRPLLDCRHSRIKLSLPSATAPHRNRQTHLTMKVTAQVTAMPAGTGGGLSEVTGHYL